MKLLALFATFLFCSCAGFGPFTAETQWGTFERGEDGKLVLVPSAKPIVIPTK